MVAGPLSPPIASTDRTTGFGLATGVARSGWEWFICPKRGLRRVFFQIDLNSFGNHFARRVETARRADVVWALFLATRWAIMGIFCNQKIVATTLPTTGFGDFILWDGHCATSGFGGHLALIWIWHQAAISRQPDNFRRVISDKSGTVEHRTERGGEHTAKCLRRKRENTAAPQGIECYSSAFPLICRLSRRLSRRLARPAKGLASALVRGRAPGSVTVSSPISAPGARG